MNLKRKSVDMTGQNFEEGERERRSGPSSMNQGREKLIKRARRACTNCRQKKIRCSGDQPCHLCTKLCQDCKFDSVDQDRPRPAVEMPNAYNTLPQRMLLLESKVEEILVRLRGPNPAPPFIRTANESSVPINLETMSLGNRKPSLQDSTVPVFRSGEGSRFAIPPLPVLTTACDVYFMHCHNQPYSYFHERTFRHRLAANTIPKYLIFTLLATALRFSLDPYWRDMQLEAADAYARESWKLIASQQLVEEDGMSLEVVQAANMLAIIDFTAGRLRLAWMKIGLAIRVAQDLRLTYEVGSDTNLNLIEREEQRRSFWSVYLLDKLVSCGQGRPLAILNADCKVLLPCGETEFCEGKWQKAQTICELLHESGNTTQSSPFGMVILMASHLGSCVRYSLQGCSDDEYPPWDLRSKFARIKSALTSIESYTDLSKSTLSANVNHYGTADDQESKHVYFAHALFHLSQCLLHHPFLLRARVNKCVRAIPQKFLSVAFQTCNRHAGLLSEVLTEAARAQMLIGSSFYSYCLTVSTTVHCLFLCNKEVSVQELARRHLQTNLELLGYLSRYWKHAALMSVTLNRFKANIDQYSTLLDTDSSTFQNSKISTAEDEKLLWSLVDYGLMSKSSPTAMHPQNQVTDWTLESWLSEVDLDTQFLNQTQTQTQMLEGTSYGSNVFGFS